MDSSRPGPSRVAIVGGGFAGLCLLIGLQKYAHIEATVYESAEKFSELGAAAVLGPNAQRAMAMIDPRILEGYKRRAMYTDDAPDDAGLYTWAKVCKGQEPDVDAVVADFKDPEPSSTIGRAHFLEELIRLVEPGRTRFGKKLVDIHEVADDPDAPLTLYFRDGSTAEADIVIGADGIHSVVRKHVLGADHPAANAFYTGIISYRSVVPFDEAQAVLGDELVKARFGLRCGQNGLVFGFPMTKKSEFYISVVILDPDSYELVRPDKWNVPVDTANLRERFKTWDSYTQKLVSLVPQTSATRGWSIWEMPLAPTYTKGRVSLVGDAAHASTPFGGAGAGQAIEDVNIMNQVLRRYLDPSRKAMISRTQVAEVALQSYDAVRRLRSQKVVATAAQLFRYFSGTEEGVGAGKELAEYTEGKLSWVYTADEEEQVGDVCLLFERTEYARAVSQGVSTIVAAHL